MSFDYLRKFNELSAEVKAAASSPESMAILDQLEGQYHVNLASSVMRILVKEIKLDELENHLLIDLKMGPADAVAIGASLREKVLAPAMKYLTEPAAPVAKGMELAEIEPNLPDVPSNHGEAEEEILELSSELKELNREKVLKIDLNPGKQDDVFNEDDESEISILAQQISDLQEQPKPDATEENIAKLIEECKISFSSQILVDRFKQILSTYLKGIRKKIETKDAMLKSIEAGGLNLDEDEVERVMALSQKYLPSGEDIKQEQPKKMVLPEDKLAADRSAVLKEIGARDVEYDLGKAIEARQAQGPAETPAQPLAVVKPLPPTLAVEPKAEPAPAVTEPIKKSFSFFRSSDAIGKKKMEDVKFVPKTMGPIDELRFMDTISFRRLSKSAEEGTSKLKDKIALLEKEQYSKKLEGIKAWRQSPLNQLYVSMTQLALSQRMGIDQVIAQKTKANEDCLNQSEFEAIMKLNQELRF